MAKSKTTFQPDYSNPPQIINGEIERVSAMSLKNHPDNSRKGDIGEISDSIRVNGFYGHLIVQRSTNYILAGNHRYLAGVNCGMLIFPVQWVDVDEKAALRIVAVDNATSDKAEYYKEKQLAMLTKLAAMGEDSLKGSGYQQHHLDRLTDQLAGLKARSEAAAAKKKGEGDDRFAILIICDDPDDQNTRFAELEELGLQPRRTILNERTKLALG